MPTLTNDIIQTTDAGFDFPAGETWTFAPGVIVSSTHNVGVSFGLAEDGLLINHGTILSTRPSPTEGQGVGAWVQVDDIAITNAADGTIIGYQYGLLLDEDGAAIVNHGTVESFYAAIQCGSSMQGLLIDNTGIIRGREIGIGTHDGGGAIRNAGLIEGTRSAAIYGYVFDGALSIFNAASGVIRGGDRAISQFGEKGVSIENRGTIIGKVDLLSLGGDIVRNSGRINGDVVLGDGADVFNGNGGKSGLVFGGAGNDRLAGGSATDRFDGGYGNDILVGRSGKDHFLFTTDLSHGPNIDSIGDFTVNVDKIYLDTGVFSLGPHGILRAALFHVGPHAADASDRIIYNPNTGALFYDPDSNGVAPQVKFAQLAKHLALDNADFVVIG